MCKSWGQSLTQSTFQPSSLPALQPSLPALQPSNLPAFQPSSSNLLNLPVFRPSSPPTLQSSQPSSLPSSLPSNPLALQLGWAGGLLEGLPPPFLATFQPSNLPTSGLPAFLLPAFYPFQRLRQSQTCALTNSQHCLERSWKQLHLESISYSPIYHSVE